MGSEKLQTTGKIFWFGAVAFVVVWLLTIGSVEAAVTVTPASGGLSISADTMGSTYTTLTGPILAEGATGDIGVGTIILNTPTGFLFDTGGVAPTVLVTRTSGNGADSRNINDVTSGTSLAITSRTTTQIVLTITAASSNSVKNSLTWQDVRVRPQNGTPLASGNVTKSGTSVVSGVTGGSTNLGTLTEVVGAKSQLVITTQPSTSATTATDFGTKPVVAVRDQFGNTVTTDNSTTISRSVVLSSQACGGTAGSGALTSTPASGAAVSSGVLTYTAMQYSAAESIKICFSSAGMTFALSNAITVSAAAADTSAPTGVGNSSPANGSTGVSTSPTLTALTASDATGPVSYYFELYTGSACSGATAQTRAYGTATTWNPTALSGGATYAWWNKARDAVSPTPNESAFGTCTTFTTTATPDTTAPAVVSDLTLSNPSNNAITVSWTASGDDGNTGTATTYDVRYSTSPITAGNFSSATPVTGEPSPSVAGTAESMTVSGLSPSTTYYFAIQTSDEATNTSAISNIPSLATTATPDTTAPAAISDLTTSNPTQSSINVSWTAPGDDGGTGTATTYDLRYSAIPITEGNWSSATQVSGEPTPQIAGTNQTTTVSGLSPGTSYFFAMKTSDEASNVSAISNVANGTTSAASGSTTPEGVGTITTAPGGTSAPSSAFFYGQAYPSSTIRAYRKRVTDPQYEGLSFISSKVHDDGTFETAIEFFPQGEYLFAMRITDRDGRETNVITLTKVLPSGSTFIVRDIIVPPTIELEKAVVSQKEALTVFGFAAPNIKVEAQFASSSAEVVSGADGSYRFLIETRDIVLGNHTVKTRQLSKTGKASDYSLTKTFRVSSLASPKADLNGDDVVDLADWSIFLFRWGSNDATLKTKIDFNGDEKVTLADFSVLMRSMRLRN